MKLELRKRLWTSCPKQWTTYVIISVQHFLPCVRVKGKQWQRSCRSLSILWLKRNLKAMLLKNAPRTDKQDEEEEEEINSVVAALTQQVADMGKAYNELGKAYNELAEDVSEVVQLTHKAFVAMDAETKSYSDFEKRMADMEKKIGERPRRASQSPETELDPESKLAESLKQRNLSDVPEPFQEMFKPEGATS